MHGLGQSKPSAVRLKKMSSGFIWHGLWRCGHRDGESGKGHCWSEAESVTDIVISHFLIQEMYGEQVLYVLYSQGDHIYIIYVYMYMYMTSELRFLALTAMSQRGGYISS